MAAIRILPEILSNKIAAGEVVERPFSVVKELVENSLDAGADRIMIEIENGGRSLIRVSDNGCGMSRDDALLSIERYATSKIQTDEDLFAIRTLGFRGEALPSIAAVSRLIMETGDHKSSVGTRIEIEGGKLKSVSEIGAPKGTQITVKNLFFNIPARRKFLKTDATEFGHIADAAASIALGWPNVQFRLYHQGKIVKNWASARDSLERIIDVLGSDLRDELLPVCLQYQSAEISGSIALPQIARSTSRGMYIYVNGRLVKDRMIQHAIAEGYSGRLMKGQFPVGVLFIRIDPKQVDVNVHPTKDEVRFSDSRKIHDAVCRAVRETLSRSDRNQWNQKTADRQQKATDEIPKREDKKPKLTQNETLTPNHHLKESQIQFPYPPQFVSHPHELNKSCSHRAKENPSQTNGFRVIGQYQGTYVIAEYHDHMILIDQHAAHERILYEQLTRYSSKTPTQSLLIPEVLELRPSEAAIVGQMLEHFNTMGFEIEPFGFNTFIITSAPEILAGREIKPLIVELVEKMSETGMSASPPSERMFPQIDECLKLIACHGAIRANQTLSEIEMRELWNQLQQCDNPSHCPHGRPTTIKWSTQFLEKSFGRIL